MPSVDILSEWLAAAARSPEGQMHLLATARILGLVLVAPCFSSRALSMRLKVAIALVLGLAIAVHPSNASRLPPASAAVPWLAIATEGMIGAAFGWAVFLVFGAVRSMATLFSEQIGFGFGGIIDPSSGPGSAVLRGLFGALALFVLLATDLHHALLRGVAESFAVIPPGQVFAAGVVDGLARLALAGGAFLFEAVVLLALPVSAVLMLVTVAQGVMTRLFPELETVLFGMLLRGLVAIGVIAFALPSFVTASESLLTAALEEGRTLVRSLTTP